MGLFRTFNEIQTIPYDVDFIISNSDQQRLPVLCRYQVCLRQIPITEYLILTLFYMYVERPHRLTYIKYLKSSRQDILQNALELSTVNPLLLVFNGVQCGLNKFYRR
jgi:hypothetical protein